MSKPNTVKETSGEPSDAGHFPSSIMVSDRPQKKLEHSERRSGIETWVLGAASSAVLIGGGCVGAVRGRGRDVLAGRAAANGGTVSLSRSRISYVMRPCKKINVLRRPRRGRVTDAITPTPDGGHKYGPAQ